MEARPMRFMGLGKREWVSGGAALLVVGVAILLGAPAWIPLPMAAVAFVITVVMDYIEHEDQYLGVDREE